MNIVAYAANGQRLGLYIGGPNTGNLVSYGSTYFSAPDGLFLANDQTGQRVFYTQSTCLGQAVVPSEVGPWRISTQLYWNPKGVYLPQGSESDITTLSFWEGSTCRETAVSVTRGRVATVVGPPLTASYPWRLAIE